MSIHSTSYKVYLESMRLHLGVPISRQFCDSVNNQTASVHGTISEFTCKERASPYRPDRLWGPPNLLYNGYRGLFVGGKAAGA
jgi:hypothetical protein